MLILVSANDQKDSIIMHTAFNGGAFQHCIAGQDFADNENNTFEQKLLCLLAPQPLSEDQESEVSSSTTGTWE